VAVLKRCHPETHSKLRFFLLSFFLISEISRRSFRTVPSLIYTLSVPTSCIRCLYRWLCGYCYILQWLTSIVLYDLFGLLRSKRYCPSPDRQTTSISSSFPCVVSVHTSSGHFLCLLTLAMEHCLLACDIVLGCDWFVFCSTTIPGDTIILSDSSTVLDFFLLPRACLRSQSGESFYSCYSFLIISKSTS
jgi:hypothetical protein